MKARTSFIRPVAAVLVLVGTIALVIAYYAQHPEVRQQLRDTPVTLLALLLGLYTFFVGSIALINNATFRIAGAKVDGNESLLLTMYSSIINFFGPLQSGPAFRAVYLKAKHGTLLRNYTAATFLYYIFYALVSGIFLLSGVLKWWLLPLLALIGVVGWALSHKSSRFAARMQGVNVKYWRYLAFATFLQVAIQAIIYFVELRSILPDVSVGQAIIYTGAANFALFVSITPGAIGFRESFLLFSQNLHHIPNDAIIVATTIDRTVYVLLLILLAIGIFSSHANQRFTAYRNSAE